MQIKEIEKSVLDEDEQGILSFDEDDIPDPKDQKGEPEKPKRVVKERLERLQLTEEQVSYSTILYFQLPSLFQVVHTVRKLLQKKNLVIPPRMPAKTNGRRRATLIITPASLISHWLAQIEEHVDKGVDLNIMVHHGTSKR